MDFLLKKNIKKLIPYLFAIFFILGIIFPYVASATIYQPGETLDPDCQPISVDCGVAVLGFTPLNPAHNLSDLLNISTARTNLGLGILSTLSAINNDNWFGTVLSVLNGGTGTSNGSITGTGALLFTSDTTLDLESGTGNIGLQAAGIDTTGNVQIGAGNEGSDTPDLLILDVKNTPDDPTGTEGAMFYNSHAGKFRCFENGVWIDCIAPNGGSNLQHVVSYDSSEALINVPTGGAQITLGTISITPNNTTGDIYITGWADVYSSNGADQPLQIVIENTSNCTGTTVGNASVTYTITSGGSAVSGRGTIRVSGIVIDAGASAHPYSLCAAVASGVGDSDILNWGIEALVIDSGADLAEIYTTNDKSLEAGDVVSIDPSLKIGVKKSSNSGDKNVIGIVSTRPGMIIGDVDKEGVKAVPVALSGRVQVKVVTENGALSPGDYLSTSSTRGVAMKSDGVGLVIGQAIGAYDGDGVGTLMVFVKNFDLGYPDETLTEKIHPEQICLKKSDGEEVCIDGDTLGHLLDISILAQDSE